MLRKKFVQRAIKKHIRIAVKYTVVLGKLGHKSKLKFEKASGAGLSQGCETAWVKARRIARNRNIFRSEFCQQGRIVSGIDAEARGILALHCAADIVRTLKGRQA